MENTQNTDKSSDIINKKEAAKILGISERQVEKFKHKGLLPYYRLSRKCIRYRRSDCEAFLSLRRVGHL